MWWPVTCHRQCASICVAPCMLVHDVVTILILSGVAVNSVRLKGSLSVTGAEAREAVARVAEARVLRCPSAFTVS